MFFLISNIDITYRLPNNDSSLLFGYRPTTLVSAVITFRFTDKPSCKKFVNRVVSSLNQKFSAICGVTRQNHKRIEEAAD